MLCKVCAEEQGIFQLIFKDYLAFTFVLGFVGINKRDWITV